MTTENEATQILECRNKSIYNDSSKLQKIRESWIFKLTLMDCIAKHIKWEKIPGMDSRYGNEKSKFDERLVGKYKLEFLEMYPLQSKSFRTKSINYQFFNKRWNTRTKLNCETILEFDNLDFNKTISIICEVISNLIKDKYHFAVFYAQGQRSPHIRIYDLEDLEYLNPQQRLNAQIIFWKKYVPSDYFKHVDTGILIDNHYLCLEFAPHWKYHTPFNLLFEWIPQEEKCNL